MIRFITTACSLAFFLPAAAVAAKQLDVTVSGIEEGAPVPSRYAHCVATETEKSAPGQDETPKLSWSAGPEGTKSYAVVMVDPDVPTSFDKAGKEGMVVEENQPRQNFYHWAVVDIPAATQAIGGEEPAAGRAAVNDYPTFMGLEVTSQVADQYRGYNGPCPPWNDERVHHYHFRVYALDVPTLDLKGDFRGKDVMEALGDHVLAQGERVGTYTLNLELSTAPQAAAPVDINF